jgi:hypothetical protein
MVTWSASQPHEKRQLEATFRSLVASVISVLSPALSLQVHHELYPSLNPGGDLPELHPNAERSASFLLEVTLEGI